jgi:hypothetical protein
MAAENMIDIKRKNGDPIDDPVTGTDHKCDKKRIGFPERH